MSWCRACTRPPAGCVCCKCERVGLVRIRADNCKVPSHLAGYTDTEMGTILGQQMTRIIEAKRRQDVWRV